MQDRMNGDAAPALTILVTICDRDKGKKITGLFKGRSEFYNWLTLGRGTANSKILNYLGLGATEKVILFNVLTNEEAREVLSRLDETLDLKKPGHGIAFTLPLSGMHRKKLMDCAPQENGGNEVEHELIFAVVNRGYTEEVMDAARAANAVGGTIVHARSFALEGAQKFFGLTVLPEKEVIMILTESDKRRAIMQNIAEKVGPATDAGAVTFSLPVTGVEGLRSPCPSSAEK